MAGNSSVEFQFYLDDDRELKPVGQYKDAGFPAKLIDNLRKAGYDNPSKLQRHILQCMVNNLGIVGNVPDDLDAQVAYIAFAIHDCIKAKEERKYRPDEYKPYGLFIVKNDEMMQKCCLFAKELAKDLGVSAVMLSLSLFGNEAKCEFALQNCDLVFLTAEGFNRYVKDELILFENLKILAVHQLEWEDDKKRIVQYNDMFMYHDFPKAGERIFIFFDENYSTPDKEVLKDDAKGYLVFGGGDGTKKLRNFVINGEDFTAEAEEIFEVCESKAEKDAALVKHVEVLREFYSVEKPDYDLCPRTVIYVKDTNSARDVERLLGGARIQRYDVADGLRKRVQVREALECFNKNTAQVLIACNLQRLEIICPNFKNVTNIIHYDAPEHCCGYLCLSQINGTQEEPKKIVSLLGAVDYPAFKDLLDHRDYIKRAKSVQKLQEAVDTLKPGYDRIPEERYDESKLFCGYY